MVSVKIIQLRKCSSVITVTDQACDRSFTRHTVPNRIKHSYWYVWGVRHQQAWLPMDDSTVTGPSHGQTHSVPWVFFQIKYFSPSIQVKQKVQQGSFTALDTCERPDKVFPLSNFFITFLAEGLCMVSGNSRSQSRRVWIRGIETQESRT